MRLYDVPSGKLLRRYSMAEDDSGGHSGAAGRAGAEQVVGVSWLPDSRRFVAATHRGLALVDAGREGPAAVLRRLQPPHAFLYDAVVAGGDCVITVGQDKKIGFCR